MGAPVPEMNAADVTTTETLLSSLETVAATERRKHATVLDYWLSIRGDRQFPPIRDLDPLELSDAGPFSILLEMIGGGEDAEIRHLGGAISSGIEIARIGESANPSLLSCIAARLPIIASRRQAFAFEDSFEMEHGPARCWVTLLPFSANGTWIDYVYGFVSLDPAPGPVDQTFESAAEVAEVDSVPVEATPEPDESLAEPVPVEEEPPVAMVADVAPEPAAPEPEPESEREPEDNESSAAEGKPGFSAKLCDSLASVSGFYGHTVELAPAMAPVPFDAAEPEHAAAEQPKSITEGSLQSKLNEVRAKADEARMAKLRSNLALLEGLSAAYDFALDAEEQPEDYLKLVEAQGLKIQLRSPMAPVVKLAFDGLCDESTIAELEAVLAWALKMDLPRGVLAERIEAEGGIGSILSSQAQTRAA